MKNVENWVYVVLVMLVILLAICNVVGVERYRTLQTENKINIATVECCRNLCAEYVKQTPNPDFYGECRVVHP